MTNVLEPDIEEQPNVRIVERVVDVPALLAVPDESTRPEQPQVVRAGRLRKTGDSGEVTNAKLTRFQQCGDQSDPAGVRENTERLRKVLEHGLAREPFQNGLNAFGFHALGCAAVKRGQSWGQGCLHSYEDNIAPPA